MYFQVNNKKAFATTGGKTFDNKKPTVIFLHGSGLDHTFWGLHSRFFAFLLVGFEGRERAGLSSAWPSAPAARATSASTQTRAEAESAARTAHARRASKIAARILKILHGIPFTLRVVLKISHTKRKFKLSLSTHRFQTKFRLYLKPHRKVDVAKNAGNI